MSLRFWILSTLALALFGTAVGCGDDDNNPPCAEFGAPPSAIETCDPMADDACRPGQDCRPARECVPTECQCTDEGWSCTGCAFPNVCTDPMDCGDNPADVPACSTDADCAATERCGVHPDGACIPSNCSCNAFNGNFVCTSDCRTTGACIPR